MGQSTYNLSELGKVLYRQANDVLGYSLTEVMFSGSEDDLRQTKITQPAIFVQSTVAFLTAEGDPEPDAVAGHSLGEYSALVAAGALSFPDALRLVRARAQAMQAATETDKGTMAAVLGLDDDTVDLACREINETVVAANYNSPGQVVISGTETGVETASKILRGLGAKRVLPLKVGGAFHSPLMEAARGELAEAIRATHFQPPSCPIYQNVDAAPNLDPDAIKENLIAQLTGSVRWTQTIQAMQRAGIRKFVEVGGKGRVLAGMIRKVDRKLEVEQLEG
jgi:[acyl-carrier-protein] S-malonyltransferase